MTQNFPKLTTMTEVRKNSAETTTFSKLSAKKLSKLKISTKTNTPKRRFRYQKICDAEIEVSAEAEVEVLLLRKLQNLSQCDRRNSECSVKWVHVHAYIHVHAYMYIMHVHAPTRTCPKHKHIMLFCAREHHVYHGNVARKVPGKGTWPGLGRAGVRGNLFPSEFVPRELFPEGICSVRNKFTGYYFFWVREFVPHPRSLFPVYLPYRTSRYFVLHARYTVLPCKKTDRSVGMSLDKYEYIIIIIIKKLIMISAISHALSRMMSLLF